MGEKEILIKVCEALSFLDKWYLLGESFWVPLLQFSEDACVPKRTFNIRKLKWHESILPYAIWKVLSIVKSAFTYFILYHPC